MTVGMSMQRRPVILPCLLLAVAAAHPAVAQVAEPFLEASVQSEAMSPDAWGGDLHQIRAVAGARYDRFRLFGSLSARGLAHARTGVDGLWVRSGVDTTLTVGSLLGDSIDVAFPSFERWDDGTHPFDQRGRGTAFLRTAWAGPNGLDIAISYAGDRARRVNRATRHLFNPEGWGAEATRQDGVTLSGRFQPALLTRWNVQVNAEARHARAEWERGVPDADWILGRADPGLGFVFGVDFLEPPAGVEYDDRIALGLRHAVIPTEEYRLGSANELYALQTVRGMSVNARLNPFGVNAGLPFRGVGGSDDYGYVAERTRESGLSIGVDLFTQVHAATVGLDWTSYRVDDLAFHLIEGYETVMERREPNRWGVRAADRLALGPFDLEAGIRFDRIDLAGFHPRVPGFVSSVPDSLRSDAWVLDPLTGPEDERTLAERIVPLASCNGSPVCLDNFIRTNVQTGWSPHAALSFRFMPSARVRIAYTQQMHGPGDPAGSTHRADAGRWIDAVFVNVFSDVEATGTGVAFGRDVRLPRTRLISGSYVHEFDDRFAIELGAYQRKVVDAFAFRSMPFQSPATGRTVNLLTLVNRDRNVRNGFDVVGRARIARFGEVSVHYERRETDIAYDDPVLDDGLPRTLPRGPLLDFEEAWTGGFGASSNATLDRHRKHTVRVQLSVTNPAGTGLFADAGIRAELSLTSGLRYHPLFVFDASAPIGPPMPSGAFPDLSRSDETPWLNWLELRVHKGIALPAGRLRLFAHWAGPLRAERHQVFLATGSTEHAGLRAAYLGGALVDSRLDGDTQVDDFFVGDCLGTRSRCEVPESQTVVNAYALKQAEINFGDGDGLFTVAEQQEAFGAAYDLFHGSSQFTRSDRSLRLGVELVF